MSEAMKIFAEVFRMNGKLVIIHPRTKTIVPAPEGAKVGQKVEVLDV